MDINSQQQLEVLFTDLDNGFRSGLDNPPNMQYMEVVSEFGSESTQNFYPWLAKTQEFVEWSGGRQFADVISERFIVKNRKFETSVRMGEDQLEDEGSGLYLPIAERMGEAWQQLRLRLPTNVIVDNFISFDGLPILDSGHAYGQFPLDNFVTTPLSSAAIEAADQTAGEWKFENGDPTATNWTHLVVGPALKKRAWDIFENQLLSDGAGAGNSVATQNYFSSAERKNRIIINPYLTKKSGEGKDVDASFFWFLIDKSRSIGPVGLQTRRAVRTIMDTDPGRVQRTGNVDFMADGRLAALPTFAHLIYGSHALS